MATIIDDAQPRRGQMREGLRIQARVIGALMMRELHTRYGRENLSLIHI